jgi:hypothetical protein
MEPRRREGREGRREEEWPEKANAEQRPMPPMNADEGSETGETY